MKADKKDPFKQLLKQAPADLPKADFTEGVMNFIEADMQREEYLKTLLQQQPVTEGPPFDFTASVMAQIAASKTSSSYKPIITKQAWYGIAAFLVMSIAAIFMTNSRHKGSSNAGWLSGINHSIVNIPTLYFIGIAAAAGLLFIDYLLSNTIRKNKQAV